QLAYTRQSNLGGAFTIHVMDMDTLVSTLLTPLSEPPFTSWKPSWLPTVDAPQSWSWNATSSRWEDSTGAALDHGSNSDQNIIVDVTYDKTGRMLSLRNPQGHETEYTYDALNRR